MGWGFRKALNFWPLRINFSKSGIGASVGVRGARVGINAKGQKYSQISGGGFFHRANHGSIFADHHRQSSNQPYEFFTMPLRFPAAVVQEVQHAVTTQVRQPHQLIERGAAIQLTEHWVMTIEVVPIQKGSEVRFYVWEGAINVLATAPNRQQFVDAISGMIEALRQALGGVAPEVASTNQSLSEYLGTPEPKSGWGFGRVVFALIAFGVLALWGIVFSNASKPTSPVKTINHVTSPTPLPPPPTPPPSRRKKQVATIQSSANGTGVYVRGYTRRDGTYVHPHYRHR